MASTWNQQLTAKLIMAVIDKLEEQTGELEYDGFAELMGPDISREMIKPQIAMLEKQAEQPASGIAAPVKRSRDMFAGIDDDDDEELGEAVDDGGHADCDHESDEAQDGDEGQDEAGDKDDNETDDDVEDDEFNHATDEDGDETDDDDEDDENDEDGLDSYTSMSFIVRFRFYLTAPGPCLLKSDDVDVDEREGIDESHLATFTCWTLWTWHPGS
ncbi:hypothetical protein BDV19DRAFT_389733 [Aspergillus venezuelensis]